MDIIKILINYEIWYILILPKIFKKSLSRKIKRYIDEITKKSDIQDLTVINFFLNKLGIYKKIEFLI